MQDDGFLGALAGLALSDLARIEQRQRVKNMLYNALIAAVIGAISGLIAAKLALEPQSDSPSPPHESSKLEVPTQ